MAKFNRRAEVMASLMITLPF